MIPKQIHYIWFGKRKNDILNTALCTWRKYAPDYSIIEWNEDNLPYYNNKFYREAIKNKDYAFASDYARLKVLEKYGGIYLDTDMYLLKNLNNILANHELVFGILNKDYIFSTSFIACIPNQEFIKEALKVYENYSYEKEKMVPNTVLLSSLMSRKYNFENKNVTQKRKSNKVVAYNSNILLEPSFKSVALHIGEKTWSSHNKHDQLRIRFRKHVKNQFEAGVFRILNDIFRKII